MNTVKELINNTFSEKEPWQIVTITSTSVLGAVWVWNFCHQDESLLQRGKKQMCKFVRYFPSISAKINDELEKLNDTFEKDALRRCKDVDFITELPIHGMDHHEIVEKLKESTVLGDYDWQNGKVSGSIYRNDEQLIKLMADAYGIASYTNPLHPDVFPGICKMESEVVKISCRLFNGDDKSCGTMTYGGTESILLACKAFRDYARETKGIRNPEMVVPVTVHSAFDKAAQFLNIKRRVVPVNSKSWTVNIDAMERAISKNTIMLVGSTPNFPYGTMDNIEAISQLGLKYNIPVHVDACLGGFLLCFMPHAGYQLPPFDFALPGVTSISADTHKYGYAPKGSSVILYREKKYRHYQYTISTDWPGGIYGSPTISGSRAGGIIAACWATMMYIGHKGYVTSTQKIIDTTRYIESELRKMDDIFIFGTPATSVIAIGSEKFHIYRLSEGLASNGWNLNTLQFPSAIHLCVTHVHTQPKVADSFLNDVRNIIAQIHENPNVSVEGRMALYGMSQTLGDRSIVKDLVNLFIDSMYFVPKCEEK